MKRAAPLVLLCSGMLSAAHAGTLSFTINNTVDLQNVTLAWYYDESAIFPPPYFGKNYARVVSGSSVLSAGSTTFFVQDQNFFNAPSIGFSIFATYAGGTGASVAFNQTAATNTYLGNPWPILFGSGPSEGMFISALQVNNADTFDQVSEYFVPKGAFTQFGATSTIVNFSNGTNGGTVTAAITPEPAPVATLALGALGLLVRRRRTTKPQ